MTDENTQPNYARVGGWSLMEWPPFDIEKVSYFNYFVDAELDNLQALCDSFFKTPSGGQVVVKPMINQVIISFADIAEATVRNRPEAGSTPEKDLLLWFPVVLMDGDTVKDVLVFCPYVYVANAVAVQLGREMFGFPKNWCEFDSYPDSPGSTASMVCKTYGIPPGTDVLKPYKNLQLNNTGGNGSFAPIVEFGEIVEEVFKVFKNLLGGNGLSAVQNIEAAAIFLKSLKAKEQDFLYLKQFPSMTQTNGACFQQIAKMKTGLGAIKQFAFLPFNYTLEYWDDQFHKLGEAFGWGTGPLPVTMSFWLDFSFSIESAEILWDSGAG